MRPLEQSLDQRVEGPLVGLAREELAGCMSSSKSQGLCPNEDEIGSPGRTRCRHRLWRVGTHIVRLGLANARR